MSAPRASLRAGLGRLGAVSLALDRAAGRLPPVAGLVGVPAIGDRSPTSTAPAGATSPGSLAGITAGLSIFWQYSNGIATGIAGEGAALERGGRGRREPPPVPASSGAGASRRAGAGGGSPDAGVHRFF